MDEIDFALETPLLSLRPLSLGDADALWPYVSDPELPRHMTWEAHRDRSLRAHPARMGPRLPPGG